MDDLKSMLHKYGQDHLGQALDSLADDKDRQALFEDLKSIDYEEMCGNFRRSTKTVQQNGHGEEAEAKSVDDLMEPIEDDLCGSVTKTSLDELESYQEKAFLAISEGQVGVLLLAGGQGTRLGVPYPKGMFNIGLPSGKTLYQIQVERILRLEKMAKDRTGKLGHIIMYVMTSEHTKRPTEEFFLKHDYFGMRKENIVFFEQRMIPCFDFNGKIILASATKVARSPDGNGGLYWALKHEGILLHMERTGIAYLHAYCVDNVLVKVADPVFVGYCIDKGAESGNKVVQKVSPNEAVGVVCRVDGKFQVVEYSEIGTANAEATRPSGKLLYYAGNICNHFFTTKFLRRICDSYDTSLPHHVAKKKIPSVDNPDPRSPNGIKLEKFVFDVFQFSDNFVVWECLREEEFSPLKNADKPGDSDTPTTSREALLALHKRFVEKAGGRVETLLEISPLLSYAGENLSTICNGVSFDQKPTVILD